MAGEAKPSSHRRKTKAYVFYVLERFLAVEAHSGVFLFGATVLAMVLANSPLANAYFDFWHLPFGLELGERIVDMDLKHWINNGLMALFFLLIGLEIKRELLVGELSSLRKASFPIAAAIGGMLLPLVFYLSINFQPGGKPHGFGVPMATDIAFVLGFLLILGKRIPLSLKVFLTSLAVVDDLGAVLMIAVFYSNSVDWASLGWALAILSGLVALNITGIRKLVPYLLLGAGLWFFIERSGIHATVAGVLLAMTIPVRSRISSIRFLEICSYELNAFSEEELKRQNMLLTPTQQDSLETLSEAYEAVQNPLVRLEHVLHPISAFFIMPLFALANAGVQITGITQPVLNPVTLGIILGLALGKPLGIFGFAYLAERLGWAQRPANLPWRLVLGAGILGGVGFTMSIFISHLVFSDPALMAIAKLVIVTCSFTLGVIGVGYLFLASRKTGGKSAIG